MRTIVDCGCLDATGAELRLQLLEPVHGEPELVLQITRAGVKEDTFTPAELEYVARCLGTWVTTNLMGRQTSGESRFFLGRVRES